jgi:hypothetical protein
MILQSPADLAVFIEENEVGSLPAGTIAYPCIPVLHNGEIIQVVSIGDFYPDPNETVGKVYVAMNWHRDAFDVTDTEPANLHKLTNCQKFLTGELNKIAALKGEAKAQVIALDHKRMRRRASLKMAERAKGATASDAESLARIHSEEIDSLHVAAVRNSEEMYGLWERCRSTLMAIAQDRKALQHIVERYMSLS